MATILRPSLVFGPEDQLFNRFAAMARMLPVMPVICGETQFQPVYVGDVVDAVMAALARPDAAGAVYELGGPRVWRFRELLAYILKETGRRRRMVDVPMGLARLQARDHGTAARQAADPRPVADAAAGQRVSAPTCRDCTSWASCRRRWNWWCRPICGGSSRAAAGAACCREEQIGSATRSLDADEGLSRVAGLARRARAVR